MKTQMKRWMQKQLPQLEKLAVIDTELIAACVVFAGAVGRLDMYFPRESLELASLEAGT